MAKATKARKSSKSSGGHEAQVTTDHEEIRRWVEERGGHPAVVKGTESGDSALLRIDYPGFSGEGKLEPIEWEEFFEIFDENNLAFLYQEQTAEGGESRFSKFIARDESEDS
jgi:anaerobic selenocysteine-containing dehydrogenase